MSKLENLELQAKKKKNKVIIGFVVVIFGFIGMSFISFALNVDNSKVYEKRKLDKLEDLEVIKNPEFKETWSIAMENRMKKQEERTREVVEMVKNKQDSIISELKTVIMENNKNLNAQLSLMKDSTDAKFKELQENLNKKMEEQAARIDQLEKINENRFNESNSFIDNGDNIIIGPDDIPEMEKNNKKDLNSTIEKDSNKTIQSEEDKVLEAIKRNPNLSAEDKINFTKRIEDSNSSKSEEKPKKEKEKEKSKKKKLVVMNIDTTFNSKVIKNQNKINNELAVKEQLSYGSYHISTGFMRAYMVTGAYAPAFQEGSMEPLPVLFETEGDILMANNVSGNIEKCFLLGSAKGNMNSETADIKLVTVSCLINGGKARIEGSISGWVIGENGMPGLQGEMLHKNGAWLAKTFVSGFFETFATALSGGTPETINYDKSNKQTDNTTSTSSAINSNLLQAGATGISNVFSKLGDYYIKMADQIFPVIEVKGGRTVNILLIGGEDLTVVENNKVDLSKMSEMSEKIELQKINKSGTINTQNAFKRTISEDNIEEPEMTKTKTKIEKEDDNLGDIPDIVGGD